MGDLLTMFAVRVTAKAIDHFKVFPGCANRGRFFREKHKSIEVVCQDHQRPDYFLFLLYYITCIILYDVEVVKNSENIEIYEKA